MTHVESKYKDFLNRKEVKWTPERELIFQEASAMEGHFEVDELILQLRRQGSRISPATVYRTLPLLLKTGILKEVIHGEKHRHYERTRENDSHDHLVCMKCGLVVGFDDESLRNAEEEICKRHDFKKEKVVIEIFGYCNSCR